MTVDTTFLPKTNGLVFGDRLVARSDKGRVFLMDVTPPPVDPSVTILTQPQDATLVSMTRSTFSCAASGNYTITYIWQFRKPDNAWSTASIDNILNFYPDAVFPLVDAQAGTLNLTWMQGAAPTQWRCKVRDTDPDNNRAELNSRIFTLTY